MAINTYKDRLPEGFRYSQTNWYKSLIQDEEHYRNRLIIWSLRAALIVPLILLAVRLFDGDTSLCINYLIPFLVVSLLIWLFKRTKKTNTFSTLCLVCCMIGFLLCVFLPGASDTYLMLFFCYPVMAFQFFGYRRGFYWIICFLPVIVFVIILHYFVPGSLHVRFTNGQLSVSLAAFILIVILVSLRERQNEKRFGSLLNLLMFDEITGLPKRDVLLNTIRADINDLLCIITIENFRDLGGLFGYVLLDEVLRFAAEQLKNMESSYKFRSYHLRGPDFCIMFSNDNGGLSREVTEAVLNEILLKLRAAPVKWESRDICLDYRIGASFLTPVNEKVILTEADRALKAGASLHNPITVFDDEEHRLPQGISSIMKFSLLSENREKGLFKAVYQPIIENSTGMITWFEALLRIKNYQGEYESPFSYLDMARSTGIDADITDFMMLQAFETSSRIEQDVSINISVQDILRKGFIENFEQKCSAIKNRSGTIILEITEQEKLVEVNRCIDFIYRAREMGCRIAIDDFGTGHSNFSNLLYLPIDILKIDGFLIKMMNTDPRAVTIVEGLVSFCRKTGIDTVAEYVEDQTTYSLVRDLGITYSQGFFFGKPGDIEEF